VRASPTDTDGNTVVSRAEATAARTSSDPLRSVAHVLIWIPAALLAYLNIRTAIGRPDLFPDLDVYRAGAAALGHGGRHLYDVHGANGGPFTYPPIAAFLLAPARALSLEAAGVVMALLTCFAAATVARLCATRHKNIVAAIATAGAMQTIPFRTTIYFGQVGALLMFLVAVDVLPDRVPWPRGVGVGLAAAIKLTPLLFVPFLWITGRRRAAAIAAATFVGANAIAFAVLPHGSVTYWTDSLWHTNRVGDITSGRNHSLWGLVERAGGPNALALVVCAVVAVFALVRARRATAMGADTTAVTLVGLATVLASPISWSHHLVWVLPLIAVLLSALWRLAIRAAAVLVVTVAFSRLSADSTLLAALETAVTLAAVLLLSFARLARSRDDSAAPIST
jgi:hypothetical protein